MIYAGRILAESRKREGRGGESVRGLLSLRGHARITGHIFLARGENFFLIKEREAEWQRPEKRKLKKNSERDRSSPKLENIQKR